METMDLYSAHINIIDKLDSWYDRRFGKDDRDGRDNRDGRDVRIETERLGIAVKKEYNKEKRDPRN